MTTNLFTIRKSDETNVIFFTSVKTGYSIKAERTGNDLYGNPLYRVEFQNHAHLLDKKMPCLYRRYSSKGYGLMQSYNIEMDMNYIFEYIEKGVK